jgi:hypothetical protein
MCCQEQWEKIGFVLYIMKKKIQILIEGITLLLQ